MYSTDSGSQASVIHLCKIGKIADKVLPDPVGAISNLSFPSITSGIADS